jgi:outer membrane protein assembly factor BamB
LYAITPQGKLKWKYKTSTAGFSDIAIDKIGNIYFGITNDYPFFGYLVALTSTGKLKWKFTTSNSEPVSSPIVDKSGIMYFGSDDGYLRALTATGKLKWKYYFNHNMHSSPAIAKNGILFFTSWSSILYAIK